MSKPKAMTPEQLKLTFDSLFKAVDEQRERINELERRVAELEEPVDLRIHVRLREKELV